MCPGQLQSIVIYCSLLIIKYVICVCVCLNDTTNISPLFLFVKGGFFGGGGPGV
jgi:hypothetical protein